MRLLLATLFVIALVGARAASAQIRIEGTVYILSGGQYEERPGVSVHFLRHGEAAPVAVTDDNGKFEQDVPEGSPVTVVLHAPNRIPEIQALAGKNGTSNSVHVTLLTETEAESLGVVPAERIMLALRLFERAKVDDKTTTNLQKMASRYF